MIDIDQATRLIYQKLVLWSRSAISYVPEIITAILAVIIFNFLARYVRRIVIRGFARFSNNISLIHLTGSLAQVVVMAIGIFVALGMLGLDKTVTSLLAGAGVLALAVGFAFQDLTANFISGTMIALARPIQVGDIVETNGFTGRVMDIKLRSILLDNFQGQTVEIPSKDVFQKSIINYSRIGQRRIELNFAISYIDDLNKAQQLARQVVQALPFVRQDKKVEVHYKAFTNDNIQGFIWFWIDQPQVSPALALSEALKVLKTVFDQNDILMMFPPHTFDLKKRKREELKV
ncbi:small conductance mechanosensitive ion channel, MscS family [Fibrisoma limi BUZ 3]|uniref:Small conductance mechanosensitive ion channel, MscS family n=1 Tax=Fibrisoma limi BUZ 3 TaxID=1185876 RepID=I2GMS1_9BACT|nr:mechanosensitive ion channel family protein [Fibrisoma limi]CCH55199.1 small conductance mechanosensitive ion channel, MscS family [Fibrisoma limi BUZ 3]